MARTNSHSATSPRPRADAADTEALTEQTDSPSGGRPRPVHEFRLGKIKGTIWANSTEAGIRHNVTFRRLYKRDGSAVWEQAESFGRDDLPQVAEVVRMAWLWIFANVQQS